VCIETLAWLVSTFCLPAGPQVVQALASFALADAQQLTVLRAVQKGNQPSLIASLAADTAALYAQACGEVGRVGRAAGWLGS